HSPCGDRTGSCSECELKEKEGQYSEVRVSDVRVYIGYRWIENRAFTKDNCLAQEEIIHPDNTACICPECDTKTNCPENDGSQTSIDEIVQQCIHNPCLTDKTCFKHCETCLHKKYQTTGYQNPRCINRNAGGCNTCLKCRNLRFNTHNRFCFGTLWC